LRRDHGPVLTQGLINRDLRRGQVDCRRRVARSRRQAAVHYQESGLVFAGFDRRAESPDDESVAAGQLEARRAAPADDQVPGDQDDQRQQQAKPARWRLPRTHRRARRRRSICSVTSRTGHAPPFRCSTGEPPAIHRQMLPEPMSQAAVAVTSRTVRASSPSNAGPSSTPVARFREETTFRFNAYRRTAQDSSDLSVLSRVPSVSRDGQPLPCLPARFRRTRPDGQSDSHRRPVVYSPFSASRYAKSVMAPAPACSSSRLTASMRSREEWWKSK
jgi:hypothetical protein